MFCWCERGIMLRRKRNELCLLVKPENLKSEIFHAVHQLLLFDRSKVQHTEWVIELRCGQVGSNKVEVGGEGRVNSYL